ncbi:MAG: hypothetical protein KY445_15760, partial [Armatimonadetes bacterium]|nr:hypothetical protein [Armatimonadota bacterium]
MRDDWGQNFLQPQQVPVDADDPRRADHELLFAFQSSLRVRESQGDFAGNELFEAMAQLSPSRRIDLIETALARIRYAQANPGASGGPDWMNIYQGTFPLHTLIKNLMARFTKLQPEEMERLLDLAIEAHAGAANYQFPTDDLLQKLEQFEKSADLIEKWRPRFRLLRQSLSTNFIANVGANYHYGSNGALQKLATLLGTQIPDFLETGDAWADAVVADLQAMESSRRALWLSVFEHARNSKDAKPKEKWLKSADDLLQLLGKDEFLARAQIWFSLYGKDDGFWFADREERNDAYFKGLIWMASRIEDTAITPALGAALRGSFKARGRAGVRS